MSFDVEVYKQNLLTLLSKYGGNVILSLVVFLIGIKLIKYLDKILYRGLEKSKVDKSLKSFIVSITNVSLKILLFISIAGILGVDTTTFAAVIGAAGLAVGLALQGSLSNFAGGVLIILFKPFKIGDYIEVGGFAGTVDEIQVFNTVLKTPDNRVIVIPNGNLSNSSLVNYSAMDTRRVDFTFGVGYEDDINKVKEVLNKIVKEHKLIFQDPEPFIRVAEHGDSSVNFAVRVWGKSEDYWTIYFDLMETVKIRFDEEGINIPYPHMDVNIKK